MSSKPETLPKVESIPGSKLFVLRAENETDRPYVLGFPLLSEENKVKTLSVHAHAPEPVDHFVEAQDQYFSLKCAQELQIDLTQKPPVKGSIFEFDGPSDTAASSFTFRKLTKKPAWEDLKTLVRDEASVTDNSQAAGSPSVIVDLCYRSNDTDKNPAANYMVCHDELTLKKFLKVTRVDSVRLIHDINKSTLEIKSVDASDMPDESVQNDAPVWGYIDAETAETTATV